MARWRSLPNGGRRARCDIVSRRVPIPASSRFDVAQLLTMYIFLLPFFADPNTFHRHFHLVNRVDFDTVLNTADFVNEEDGQVRAAHKILGYTPT